MARSLELVVSLALWTLVSGNPLSASSNVPEGKKTVMTDSSTLYRVIEQEQNAIIQSTFAGDGMLDVTVRLPRSDAGYSWRTTLSADAISACWKAIRSVEKRSRSVAPTPYFAIVAYTSSGHTPVVSWDKESETPELASARTLLETDGHSHYYIAIAYLDFGIKADERQDPTTAGTAYKEGIATLDEHYLDPEAIDDTGMKLVLAQSTENKDGLAKAAPIYRRVLESRTALYAAREKLATPIAR